MRDNSLTRFHQLAVIVTLGVTFAAFSVAHAQEFQQFAGGHSYFSQSFPAGPQFSEPASQHIVEPLVVGCVQPERPSSEVLPNGLLYRSYIAAPHESRFASIATYDVSKGSWRWDTTLGGRVGLFRQNQPAVSWLDAWQIDLEGAALTRLNPELHMDVESVDYRFGLLWTGKQDQLAYKFGYFHLSSHVGDEYLLKNPTFERINFVRESVIFGTSFQATPERRYYGELAWATSVKGGAKPWQFQLGAEHSETAKIPTRGAPFSAVNLQFRQETNFASGVTVMTGWQWKGPESGCSFRVGLQYYNGPSNQYEFFRRYDNQFGAGMWFDY